MVKEQLYVLQKIFCHHIKESNKIGFVTLSKGVDPDDYIKEKGKKAFLEFLSNKLSIDQFIWKKLFK